MANKYLCIKQPFAFQPHLLLLMIKYILKIDT